MAVAFRSDASASGTSTSPAVSVPAGAAVGDIAWVDLYLDSNTTDTDATIASLGAAGFSMHPTTMGTQGQGARGRSFIFWKRLTAADSGTYTFGQTVSVLWEISCRLYSGVTRVGNPWIVDIGATTASAASSANTVSIPSVTPGGSDSCLVGSAISHGTGSNPWTPPTGYTERYDGSAHLTTFDKTGPTAGAATGAITATCTTTTGSTYPKGYQIPLAGAGFVRNRSATSNVFTTLSSQAVTFGTHDVGDLLTVCVFGKYDDAGAPSATAGWTLTGFSTGGTGSQLADTGPVFMAFFQKIATSSSESCTVTVGSPSPNSWSAITAVSTPAENKTWRDPVQTSSPAIVFVSDTDTASPLTGTPSAFAGQPQTDDALLVFGVIPTDSPSAAPAITISATGLSNGTQSVNTLITKTTLGADCAGAVADWMNFTGPATSGVTVSMTFSAGSQAGLIGVVALRQQAGGTTINGGQASETDTAQAGSATVGKVIAGGMATTTSTALAGVALVGAVIAGGQAVETDTAQAGTVATGQIITGGAATETDTALAGTVVGAAVIAGGQATETDIALSGAVAQTIAGGTAAETDTALAGTVLYVVSGGQATETDTAQAGSVSASLIVVNGGQATEADTALGGTVSAGYTDTDTENAVYAVTFDGDADVTWEPAVVARPALLENGAAQVTARVFADVDVTDEGMAVYTDIVEVAIPRHRGRILIGNQDWTFRYGFPLQVPDFELIDPFMYGDGGTLVLPQINARYERLGQGRLARVKLGATVKYQRVDDDPDSPTYNQVVATDYKGLILRAGARGDALSLAVGGELLGRASMKWHPVPIFRKIRDAAVQIGNAVVGLGLRYQGRFDDLGINLASRGGMFEDQYLLDTQAQLVTGDGDQWTIMPTETGAYTHMLKDRETVHATVYFDNELATPDLGDDLAEKPNRVWINAVAPDGQRIMHATAPRLLATELPERPVLLAGGGPMVINTTDADTSTGDGVTVLKWRLAFTGLLDLEDVPGGFDEDVADAIREFQKNAGCANLTGSVDAETWEKLWDNAVTDYSIAFAAQRPAVEDDAVQKFDRAGSGSIIGRHEGYDPTVPIVDLPLDMGQVANRRRAFRMARHKLHQVGQSDWVGEIVLTDGLIADQHTPGDPIDGRVIPNRAVRPGWNIWEPFFDGGTLFPVVACRISDNGYTVTLVVDTRARPAMEAWQVHQRNRENRYQPSRYLGGHRRRSTAVQDTVTPWDKIVGQTDRDWPLVAGWNKIPVPAGQVGTVKQTHILLDKPHEFAALVATADIPLGRLNDKIDPLAAPASDPQRHVIAVTGRPTGGTFKLANDALDETSAIAHDAGPGAVQAAIRGLGGSFAGVSVSGPAGGPYVVNMHGSEADIDVADNSLTGGSSPSISVSTTGPSAGDGTPWWGEDAIRRWLDRYGVEIAWGTFENPCGYGEYQKTHPDGTPSAAPLLGKHTDHQSFGYDCGVFGAVLYLYVWVGQDNLLPRQRIFRQQLDGSGT